MSNFIPAKHNIFNVCRFVELKGPIETNNSEFNNLLQGLTTVASANKFIDFKDCVQRLQSTVSLKTFDYYQNIGKKCIKSTMLGSLVTVGR